MREDTKTPLQLLSTPLQLLLSHSEKKPNSVQWPTSPYMWLGSAFISSYSALPHHIATQCFSFQNPCAQKIQDPRITLIGKSKLPKTCLLSSPVIPQSTSIWCIYIPHLTKDLFSTFACNTPTKLLGRFRNKNLFKLQHSQLRSNTLSDLLRTRNSIFVFTVEKRDRFRLGRAETQVPVPGGSG